MENTAFRVDVVKNGLCVALVSGSEDEDIEVFAQIFDDFLGMRSHIDISTDYFPLHGFKWHFDLVSPHHDLTRVDQRLIHVKNDGLSTCIISYLPSR